MSARFIIQGLISLPYLVVFAPFISFFRLCGIILYRNELSQYSEGHGVSLEGQVAIVTGSNTGIGLETAASLFALGATVVIACRNARNGELAKAEILKRLDNLKSVVLFAGEFKKQFNRLDILVNNAGLNNSGKTVDGLEQLFQSEAVSERGPWQQQLANSSARIVNLSSVMHHTGLTNFWRCSSYGVNHQSKYADSKLYMNLMSYVINKRQQQRGSSCPQKLIAVTVNPGAVRSEIWRHVPRLVMFVYDLVMRVFFLTVKQGSATSVCGAVVPTAVLEQHCASIRSTSEHQRGGVAEHSLVPYLVPYRQPWPSIGFEMLGPFAGPAFGPCTVPANIDSLSEDLWDFSANLCVEKLKAVGINFIGLSEN